MATPHAYTAFVGSERVAEGDLVNVALAIKRRLESGADADHLIFSDLTGRVVEVDLRGTEREVRERIERNQAPSPEPDESGATTRGRGRPRLGVIGREVTLLPRHWDWLASQPGGASVALRRLVDEARREKRPIDEQRRAHASAYQFSLVMAGNLPGFEESMRALFAGDRARFLEHAAPWPRDIRNHAAHLAFNEDKAAP